MVHALREIGRVLVAGGTLIDLRPLADRWFVEVLSSGGKQEAGRVTDLPQGLADDAAANGAMAEAERAGLFRRDREELFAFYYSWDSPKEMQEYMDQEWADFCAVDEAEWKQIRSRWAVSDADSRVGVRLKMLITRWLKAH